MGLGAVTETPTGFPGYSGFASKDAASLPRILQGNGYATAAIGKWHLTPDHQQGPAGPLDRWPNAWGFDYFWGFLGGESGSTTRSSRRTSTLSAYRKAMATTCPTT